PGSATCLTPTSCAWCWAISSAIDYCVNMDYRHEGGMFDFFSTAYMRSRIRNLEVLQGCTRIMVADANSLHEEIRQAWAEEH
ncbi:MAG TPA: hypothetical protein PK609_02770, partial [Candidatus Paceibacterota bacterium]|nr:hypothetical protein [Candidatus Paceibacterota bacterium]